MVSHRKRQTQSTRSFTVSLPSAVHCAATSSTKRVEMSCGSSCQRSWRSVHTHLSRSPSLILISARASWESLIRCWRAACGRLSRLSFRNISSEQLTEFANRFKISVLLLCRCSLVWLSTKADIWCWSFSSLDGWAVSFVKIFMNCLKISFFFSCTSRVCHHLASRFQ